MDCSRCIIWLIKWVLLGISAIPLQKNTSRRLSVTMWHCHLVLIALNIKFTSLLLSFDGWVKADTTWIQCSWVTWLGRGLLLMISPCWKAWWSQTIKTSANQTKEKLPFLVKWGLVQMLILDLANFFEISIVEIGRLQTLNLPHPPTPQPPLLVLLNISK